MSARQSAIARQLRELRAIIRRARERGDHEFADRVQAQLEAWLDAADASCFDEVGP